MQAAVAGSGTPIVPALLPKPDDQRAIGDHREMTPAS
jgi:hypothetical protein